MTLLAASALALSAVSAALVGAAPTQCKIAVLNVESSDAALAEALTETVADSVRDASACQVLTPSDIKSLLSYEAERQACAGSDAGCLAELGQALGVERLVSSSVHELGSATTVSVRLIDIQTAAVVAGNEAVVDGDAQAVRSALRTEARRLFQPLSVARLAVTGASAAVLVVGAALATIGGFGWVGANGTLSSPSSSRADKDAALSDYTTMGLLALGGAGLGALGVGGVVLGLTVVE